MINQNIDIKSKFNNNGFSIIEVLFALSFFAIGILAVSTLALSAISSNASARRLTDATALAEDRLEKLAALPYDDIQDGSETGGGYQITWDIIENDLMDQTKTIIVTVTCPNGWKDTNVAIRHLISKNS